MERHVHQHEHEELPKRYSPHHHEHSHEYDHGHSRPLPEVLYRVAQLRARVNDYARLLREAKVERMQAERAAGLPLS
jgi:hypothetical protein